MKQYINPDINVISILDEDILTLSNHGENGSALEIDYKTFFPNSVFDT